MRYTSSRGLTRQEVPSSGRLWAVFLCGLLAYYLLLPEQIAAQVTPEAEVAYALGILAYDDREYHKALDHFRDVVTLMPGHAHAQLYLGLSLNRVGEFAQAIPVLERALQFDSVMRRAHHPLGLAYFREQRYSDALAQFNLAVQWMPNRAATQFYLGYTHYLLQHYREALPFLQRSGELDPALALRAQYYRGVALYALERDPEARSAFEAAVLAAPESQAAQSAQRYLDAIDQRAWAQQRFQMQGTVSIQYDDNVILEPNEIEISRQGDGRTVFSLLGRVLLVNRASWRLGGEYRLFQSVHFDLHEFDTQSHTARLFARWKSGRVTLRSAADYTLTLLDSHRFSDVLTLQSIATLRQTKTLATAVSLRYQLHDYFNQFIPLDPVEERQPSRPSRDVRDRDGQSIRAGLAQYVWFNRNRSYAHLSYYFEASRHHGSDWEYDSHEIGLGVHTPLGWGIDLKLAGVYQRRDYLHVNSFATVPFAILTREDNRSRLDDLLIGSVALTRALGRSLTLSAGYVHTSNRSNLDFFDYRRNVVSLALTGRY